MDEDVTDDRVDDDLVEAWRTSGWTARRIWLLYLDVGGGEPLAEVRRRLAGDRDWPGADELALVVAVNEALRVAGLPALARHPVLDRSRCHHGALCSGAAPRVAPRLAPLAVVR